MKIHFLGANRQVTGSRYCLETRDSLVMVDCGMFQERPFEPRNWHNHVIPPEEIDALVLTHAHIDHCGLVPRLVRHGYRAPIYCTAPTTELVDIMLRDAAHIQSEDVEYKIKRHRREGRADRDQPQPLFDDRDVDRTLPLLEAVPYDQRFQVTPDIAVTFREAGHILGSAMLDFDISEEGRSRRVIFSGDIGQWDKPILQDPTLFETSADYIVMESTYGDREHEQAGDILTQLERVIRSTISAGGNVVIPTFAVERAQELLYFISQLVHDNRIPEVPIYLDSPMAVDVTEIFQRHRDRYDAEVWTRITQGIHPLKFPGLTLASTTNDSKAINADTRPSIIMSTSGMCTAGRIKHHLRRNLPRPESTILFVGYQGNGTLGRQILDGKKDVRIHGQMWPVRAKVSQIYGFSGHADRRGLLRWAGAFTKPPQRAFLTHGDAASAESLATALRNQYHWDVLIPDYQSTSDLR